MRQIIILFFFLLIFASCSSLVDIVLAEKILSDDDVRAVLNGARFRIVVDDYQIIHQLIDSSEPERRQAGVLIIEQTDVSIFFPELFMMSMDEEENVANEALRVIMEYNQEFKEFLTELLYENNPDNRRHAVVLFGKIGNENDVPFLIQFFSDSDEIVRNLATQSVHKLTGRLNPYLREALKSSVPLTAAMACRTLSYYADPSDTSELIEAFDSPHAIVQKESQLAVLKMKEGGLTYLHDAVTDELNTMTTRLAALNVLQSLKSIESIEVLFYLQDDENDGIRTRANGILNSYGDKAIPVLHTIYTRSDVDQKIRIIQQLKNIGSNKAFTLLAEFLSDSSPKVRKTTEQILIEYGSNSWGLLQNLIITGNSDLKLIAMRILRNTADPWLVKNETGLFYLIIFSDEKDILYYLNEINNTDILLRESVIALNQTVNILEEFTLLDEEIKSGDNTYLSIWQKGKEYETRAKETLKDSFDVLHDYFNKREPESLVLSANLRSQSRNLAFIAQEQKNLMDSMPEKLRTSGQEKLEQYKKLQDMLQLTWNSLDSKMKKVARMIYSKHGLTPESFF